MIDFASRIAKLDAVSLDKEFLAFVKREITGLLGALTSEEFLHKLQPEITLLVKFVIWKFTTSTGCTIGQKLLGVRYAYVPGKLRMLFILEGVVPYLIERLHALRATPQIEQIRDQIRQAEKLMKLLHILNFCSFLIQNRYPTLATRLVGLNIVPVHSRFGASAAGYTYQIRELLWHQFADFLITILPLINIQKIRRTVGNWFAGSGVQARPKVSPRKFKPKAVFPVKNKQNAKGNKEVIIEGAAEEVEVGGRGDQGKSVIICCGCGADSVMPQKVGTDHYCYYCYQTMFEEGF